MEDRQCEQNYRSRSAHKLVDQISTNISQMWTQLISLPTSFENQQTNELDGDIYRLTEKIGVFKTLSTNKKDFKSSVRHIWTTIERDGSQRNALKFRGTEVKMRILLDLAFGYLIKVKKKSNDQRGGEQCLLFIGQFVV